MAFCVTVSDIATYWFPEGVTEKEAKKQAWDWFNERKPAFEVEEYEPTIEEGGLISAPTTCIHPPHETE